MTSFIPLDQVRPGDRVTIVNRFGQEWSGRVVMLGPAGPVLNMGGRYGTPGVATAANFVRATRAKGARPILSWRDR